MYSTCKKTTRWKITIVGNPSEVKIVYLKDILEVNRCLHKYKDIADRFIVDHPTAKKQRFTEVITPAQLL